MNSSQKHKLKPIVIAVCVCLAQGIANAEDTMPAQSPQDVTKKLIEQLVQQGVLTREQADALQKTDTPPTPGEIRVPYIPQRIRDEIREQVRSELRDDVTADVLAKAKLEQWGIPGVLPTWVNRLQWYGDIRVRVQTDQFPTENRGGYYFNYQAINSAGSVTAAGLNQFFNSTEDRSRLRTRARFGMKAKIDNSWKGNVELATGSTSDPVSTNQTIGTDYKNYQVILDKAFIEYQNLSKAITAWGGKMSNPWLYSDLVWDDDLKFDGLAAKFNFLRTTQPMADVLMLDPYFTVGFFPLEEFDLYSDKYLYGAQLGFDWTFANQSKWSLGLAYYDFAGIQGKSNTAGSTINNYTAPGFMQRGNSLFDIADPLSSNNRYALATDYNLINLTLTYDLANFAPIHVYLGADFVKNIGYKISQDARTADPAGVGSPAYAKQNTGYQYSVKVGWPYVTQRDLWQVFIAYKNLKRDAVLDAFTDSDFHLGGTDTRGYILGGSLGLADDVWVSARVLSSDVINGEQYGTGQYKVSTVQLDLNAKF